MATSSDLFGLAIAALDDEIERYARLADNAKRASWLLRGSASAGFALGILIPLADQAELVEIGNALALGYLAFAASGVLVAIDRFFGLSDTRAGFISALMGLLAIRRQIAVQRLLSETGGASPEEAGRIILGAFDSMSSISRMEFSQWTEAFKQGLARLEADTARRLSGKQAGSGKLSELKSP